MRDAALITGLIGVSVAVVNWLPVWMWGLLAQADAGRRAEGAARGGRGAAAAGPVPSKSGDDS